VVSRHCLKTLSYPLSRQREPGMRLKGKVIFVHGFHGNAAHSWQHFQSLSLPIRVSAKGIGVSFGYSSRVPWHAKMC
jgi:hypothetical protein